jgi:hypothetical protein
VSRSTGPAARTSTIAGWRSGSPWRTTSRGSVSVSLIKGKETHPPTHQELPAVFVDYALTDLVYYKGDEPWKGKSDQQGCSRLAE